MAAGFEGYCNRTPNVRHKRPTGKSIMLTVFNFHNIAFHKYNILKKGKEEESHSQHTFIVSFQDLNIIVEAFCLSCLVPNSINKIKNISTNYNGVRFQGTWISPRVCKIMCIRQGKMCKFP